MRLSVTLTARTRKHDLRFAVRAGLEAEMLALEQAAIVEADRAIYSQPEGSYKRTWLFRDSLHYGHPLNIWNITQRGARYGTKVFYAKFLEFGTKFMYAREVLIRARENHRQE